MKWWTIEFKSCVLHNLFRRDFAPHTFTVVLWDLWTSGSQDKMMFSTKTKYIRSCSANYSMPLSLSLTQWMNKKSHWESFLKFYLFILFLWMRDNETIRNLKLKHCFRDNYCAQTTWLNNKIINIIINWISGPSSHMPKAQPNI